MGMVTILTPVWNGAKYLKRYLNSILEQDYEDIQLIMVNDGSTDKTAAILSSYKPKFKEKGIDYKIANQKVNKGQAAAINSGIKYVKGEFLTWPDADDFLPLDSISKRVNFLTKNIGYGYVRATANVYDENDNYLYKLSRKDNKEENLFRSFLHEIDIYVCNGCYMARTSAVLDNVDFPIFESRGGQNWQLIIPLSYNCKAGFLDDVVYHYFVNSESHSHSPRGDYKKMIGVANDHESILLRTLESMNYTESFDILKVKSKYYNRKLDLSICYKDKECFLNIFDDNVRNKFMFKFVKLFGLNGFTSFIYKVYKVLFRVVF